MTTDSKHAGRALRSDPRWPAVLAVLAITALYWTLPESLTLGPTWVFLAVIGVLLVAALVFHIKGNPKLNFLSGTALLSVITAGVAWSLGELVNGLLQKLLPPRELLRSALALWIANVLVFASWYWRMDAGGPHARDLRRSHTEGAFLFPQMTMQPGSPLADSNWKPGFIDYLFLAFNTSTAFSPTDVPVLSRWAKVLMMVQSCISLSTIAILAARAINIL